MVAWARLRRWCHGIRYTFAGHQAITIYAIGPRRVLVVACSCGREFYRFEVA